MLERFDVVVIGSGSAASQIAYTCREAGRSVAVIDSKPFGGACALRGCDPKRVLAGAGDVVDWARRIVRCGTGSVNVRLKRISAGQSMRASPAKPWPRAQDLERILFSYPTRSSDIRYMF